MKMSDLREMSPQEKRQKETELVETLFNLRFQHAVGQLENPQKMKQTKKDIARIKTAIREESIQQQQSKSE